MIHCQETDKVASAHPSLDTCWANPAKSSSTQKQRGECVLGRTHVNMFAVVVQPDMYRVKRR